MLASAVPHESSKASEKPSQIGPLTTESEFYRAYDWCLSAHLTVEQAIKYLNAELERLAIVPSGWQRNEVATNVFLLSCGLLNCIDEHLRGPTLRLPAPLDSMRVGRCAKWVAETFLADKWSQSSLQRWRDRLLLGLDGFLSLVVQGQRAQTSSLLQSTVTLTDALRWPLPASARAQYLGLPTPFRRLDLTHVDVLALGRSYVRRFPDRLLPLLLVGLRTSGSYFVPLLRALFKAEGYTAISVLTLEPNKGVGRWESRELKRYAKQGYIALIVDDPPQTAGTIFAAFEIARRAGFVSGRVRAVVPTHLARSEWSKPLRDDAVVSLTPDQWYKRKLLRSTLVQQRLTEYYQGCGFTRVSVIKSFRAEEFNRHLQTTFSDERGVRLKRIFEVRLEKAKGSKETRYVLAKSIGWGWLGYHAFLAASELSGYVPPILGLRDGILYMEWIPQVGVGMDYQGRKEQIGACASYAATRVRHLGLNNATFCGTYQQRHENGIRILSKVLSRAYGGILTDTLMRARLGGMLRRLPCPFPTLIDGNMQPTEWISGPRGPLKTDYEHHGMGKTALNVVDPAYDLADTILNFELSDEEESQLIRRYVTESGDAGVERRLFLNKLLAGIWSMYRAQDNIFSKAHGAEVQQKFHLQFMRAWNFLTVQTARHCGSVLRSCSIQSWHSPLIALDVDGVIDRRLFGFPCTTAAGIEALSLLGRHELSVVLNTARSVSEVKDYCQAYSLSGGIAEYGSYLWDAIAQRGRILISPKAMQQLDKLKENLCRMPGVFIDDRHQYSIRAFSYQDKPRSLLSTLTRSMRSASIGDGALTPLPTLVIQHLMAELGLDALRFHQTAIDTTIVAKDVDKGVGLSVFRDWVLGSEAETIAVGDHEQDLSMFRVATKAFAPANIGCAREARLIGCQIVREPYQQGLLAIARAITCVANGENAVRTKINRPSSLNRDLFLNVLQVADRSLLVNFVSALLNPSAYRIFVR